MNQNQRQLINVKTEAIHEHWPDISKIWNQVGPPLRPSSDDLQFLTSVIQNRAQKFDISKVLILGVTPEFFYLPWPKGTQIRAADNTRSMIESIWPGPEHSVIFSNWTTLPIEPNSFDLVLCDGGLHLLPYPDKQKVLIKKLHQILSPGGIAAFRLFVPPEKSLSPEFIKKKLLNGKILNLNELKFHLWMAIQENSVEGVELHNVWEFVHQIEPDAKKMARILNWPIEHYQVINTYKNSNKRYYFLPTEQVLNLFTKSPGGFEVDEIHVPDYRMGEQCPTIILSCKK